MKETQSERWECTCEPNMVSCVFEDIVPLHRIEHLLRALHTMTKVPIGLVAPDSRNILNIGWAPICEEFHRKHPEATRCCKESNQKLQSAMYPDRAAAEKCGNGLWDIAIPIMVDNQHLATLFLGQFLYDDETLDRDFFIHQAQRYDFNEKAYMEAVDLVPRISREQAETHINYAAGLVNLLAELGYKNRQLAEEVQERRLAEHALRESESQHKALVENVPGAVYQCLNDAEYSTIFISEAIEEFTGFDAQTMINEKMAIAAMIHPDDLPYVQKLVDNAVAGKRPYLLNYRMRRKDGSFTWVEERGQGVWDEDTGELRFLQGVIFDISERRRLDEERRKLDEQFARAQKLESLGVLAGGIAHDFNNLLVAILGHADLICEDTKPGTPTYESVNAIIQASQRAATLTRQMLAYSGKGHFMVESVSLSALIKKMKPFFETMFPEKYHFSYNLLDSLPMVCADAEQLKQLITNLVTNAAESYGDEAGEIILRTGVRQCDASFTEKALHNEQHEEGAYVFLEIADNGCGMTEEVKQRLCDPFFSTKFTGRGLGMAAVLGIVRGHKGLIHVESTPGNGAAIQVLFPPLVHEVESTHTSQPTLHQKTGGRILLVDDELIVRNVAKKMLERAGYSVLLAQSGWEALELLDQNTDAIDCVLLDLTMPSMDGIKTLDAIREKNTDVPVVLCSGYSEQEATSRLCKHKISTFLQKPYKADILVNTLQHVLQ